MNILCITPIRHLKGVFEKLQSFGSITYKPNCTKDDLLILDLSKYNVIFCNPNKQPFLLDQSVLKNYRGSILTASTGLNHIDVKYCKENNIKILSHKNDHKQLLNNLPSTAELSFTLMVSLLRKIPECKIHTSEFKWDYTAFMGRQIKDLNVGIIGYGRLGKMMAEYCIAFGAKVFIYDPYVFNSIESKDDIPGFYITKSLEDLFEKCDVISIHVHVTHETKYMINKSLLNLPTKDLYLINTSRGEIVNEVDVVNALKSGRLSGYGTDVVESEFDNIKNSAIIKAMNDGENIIVTPHIGGMTIEGQTKAYEWSINKLKEIK